MIPVLPWPTQEEAEIFAKFKEDHTWQTLEGYLKRCFDVVVASLGLPDSPRDEDQVSKGMKLMIEEIAKLPQTSEQIANQKQWEEQEFVNLDERSTKEKTKEEEE